MKVLISISVFSFLMQICPPVMANVFNTVVSVQCNECVSSDDYRVAAISALRDREQKVVNVVNFNEFDVRKFDVKKLQVEVCSDYSKSATKGFCRMEDGSIVKPLKLTNIAREQFILFAEELYQIDFFQPINISVDYQVAGSAWELIGSGYLPNKVSDTWRQQSEYSDLVNRYKHGMQVSYQTGIFVTNLSPKIVYRFSDESQFNSEIDMIDMDEQLHYKFIALQDEHNNFLDIAEDPIFTLGDKFQFESQQSEDYMVMKKVVEAYGFMTEPKATPSGIAVTIVACTSSDNPCQYSAF